MRMKYDPKLTVLADELRKNMTKEEKHLWYDLFKKIPQHVNRQRQFGRYIVDFFIADAKLVVEVDGSQHYTEKGAAYDAARDAFLNDCGFMVLRYSNYDVNTNFEGVCLDIMKHIEERRKR